MLEIQGEDGERGRDRAAPGGLRSHREDYHERGEGPEPGDERERQDRQWTEEDPGERRIGERRAGAGGGEIVEAPAGVQFVHRAEVDPQVGEVIGGPPVQPAVHLQSGGDGRDQPDAGEEAAAGLGLDRERRHHATPSGAPERDAVDHPTHGLPEPLRFPAFCTGRGSGGGAGSAARPVTAAGRRVVAEPGRLPGVPDS